MSSEEVDELQSDSSSSGSKAQWRASEPPVESWDDADGADEDGNWRVDIIGEEVDYDGNVLHEVLWEDWKRADGTQTTWESVENTAINSKAWTREQKKRRRALAAESLEIDVFTTTDIHNTETFLRSQAYEEKLKRAEKEPQPNRILEWQQLLAKHEKRAANEVDGASATASSGPSTTNSMHSSPRKSARQHSVISIASSSTQSERTASKTLSAKSSLTASSSTFTPRHSSKLSHTSSPQKSQITPKPARPSIKNNHVVAPVPSSQEDGEYTCNITINERAMAPLPSRNKGKERLYDVTIDERRVISPLPSRSKGKERLQDVNLAIPPLTDYSKLPRKRVKRVVRAEPTGELSLVPSSQSSLPGPSKVRHETPQTILRKLQIEWTQCAKRLGAAPITFVNDIDNDVPFEGPFLYLERGYKFAPGIDPPDSGFLTTCECDSCGPKPDGCGCQDEWEIANFAYTPQGLYAFNVPRNIEVIECNNACNCTVQTCMNRVSQRPRDVPIEIFKTRACGWGIRSPVVVQRGKVLGTYTGRLIRRSLSRALSAHLGAYCFDLDGDEMVDENEPSQSSQSMQGKYSVDSRLHGNWTRFINHSCSPNLEIYLVVHDKPTGSGMPYIAFVAKQKIPAYTEFTFDYHPEIASEIAHRAFHKKPKLPIPKDARACLCGSKQCRGYLA